MPAFSCWHFSILSALSLPIKSLCLVPSPTTTTLIQNFEHSLPFLRAAHKKTHPVFCCTCRCSARHSQFTVMSQLNDEHLFCSLPFLTTLCTPTRRPCSESFWTPLASYHSQESATVTWKYKFGLTGWQAAVRVNVRSVVAPTWTSHWQVRQQHAALVPSFFFLFFVFFFTGQSQQAALICLTGDMLVKSTPGLSV